MRAFGDYNPIVTALYFGSVIALPMFCMNPLLAFTSLIAALLCFFIRNRGKTVGSQLAYIALFGAMVIINPLVSHNGVTVLFVLNDAPITAEALFYGVVAASMILATLYWFRSFTQIMTSDKLLFLFGKLSPKLALILSMGLRYIPLFGAQSKKVEQTQRALGLYKDDNIFDRMKGGIRIFSVMVTWALENGIVTADSMTARGYGMGKRTHFSLFRFRRSDSILLSVILLLCTLIALPLMLGEMAFAFYPAITFAKPTVWAAVGYLAYGILALLPVLIETEEMIKWKFLESRI